MKYPKRSRTYQLRPHCSRWRPGDGATESSGRQRAVTRHLSAPVSSCGSSARRSLASWT